MEFKHRGREGKGNRLGNNEKFEITEFDLVSLTVDAFISGVPWYEWIRLVHLLAAFYCRLIKDAWCGI